ncbi:MAG: iron ABC transporter permease [Victivallales bacterium]|jgi:ABC transporter, permease protein
MKLFRYLFAVLITAFLFLFLLLPIYTVVAEGLNPSLIREVFSNFIYLEGLLNSFKIAIVTTLLVFLIALPMAFLYDSYDFPGKSMTHLAAMIPMILPPFVGALGFQQILGHYGVLNTILVECGFPRVDFLGGNGRFWSICLIEALHLYPILYLNLVSSLGSIDPAMQEAARNIGAGWFRRFFRITLPLLKPGILAGGSIVLIWSFTELGTPLMFGYNRVTPVQILNGLTELETNPEPYALVTVMLILSSLMYLLAKWLLRSSTGTIVKGTAGTSSAPLAGIRGLLPSGFFLLITLLAALPHIALILTAFSLNWYGTLLPEHWSMLNFENALTNKLVVPSILNSLRYSSLAMLAALAAGLVIALIVQRWKLPFAWLLDALGMLPLAVPGIVVAFGYLGMSVEYRWAAEIFDPQDNPIWLLAIAYAVRRLPYVLRSVSAGLEQTPVEFEEAARTFGAGPLRTLRKITVPLIMANLVVGALFAFSFSMLEVSDSLILAQKAEYFPITRAIFDLSQILGSGPFTACAFGVWTMLFLAATLAAAGAILGKKIGSVFRI